jgi:hypothetical protein
MRKTAMGLAACALTLTAAPAAAGTFDLLTGVDVGKYVGARRSADAVPGPSITGAFDDGDRLAGTSDVGGDVEFVGSGTPLFEPNHVGAFSFLFRRGSVPAVGSYVPIQGIDYLGGPLLDLDGDLMNGSRMLVPVMGMTPVAIPQTSSFIDLSFDLTAGQGFDASLAITLTTIAGTTPTGGKTGAINPSIDTRLGNLTAFTGVSETLGGVWRIDNLGYEVWYDSISPNSSTAADLGSFQHVGEFRGWLIFRDCDTGQFPTLAAEGLGTTLWPEVDLSLEGAVVNAAIDVFGPTATIIRGPTNDDYAFDGDDFAIAGNGGVALTDAGGDLGAYFDAVVVPHLDAAAQAFVYLESAGAGVNNSGDPVFLDTVSYDVVLVAQDLAAAPVGDVDGSGAVDIGDAAALVDVLLDPGSASPCALGRADVNGDEDVNGQDVPALISKLIQPPTRGGER